LVGAKAKKLSPHTGGALIVSLYAIITQPMLGEHTEMLEIEVLSIAKAKLHVGRH
jgi:hypothetical protein